MQLLIDILRFATISQLILLICILLKKVRSRQYVLPATFFCFAVMSYLLVDWEGLPKPLFYFFLVPTFAGPFTFWLFSKSLFDDEYVLKKWMGWVFLVLIVILYGNFLLTELEPEKSSFLQLLVVFHHIPSLIFIVLGIMEATRNWKIDLVVARMQFRPFFIILTAGLMTLTVLGEITFPGSDAPEKLELAQKLLIGLLTFFFAFNWMEVKKGFFNEPPPPTEIPEPTPKQDIDSKLVASLQQLVEGEKYYHTEGLTIRQLAEKLEVKEYKLRKTINQHLGFRNFNEYLNSYRVREACELLSDPTRKEVTVLEIAYELGYNSLAPFNKAFKTITGMTPTEWRKEKSA